MLKYLNETITRENCSRALPNAIDNQIGIAVGHAQLQLLLVKTQHNFKSSSLCLYFLYLGHVHKKVYIILYVDDLVIITDNMSTMSNFKKYIL